MLPMGAVKGGWLTYDTLSLTSALFLDCIIFGSLRMKLISTTHKSSMPLLDHGYGIYFTSGLLMFV